MSISFSKLRRTKLDPQSKLTFGKYKGCRICDVWDDYEYFLWLAKENPGLFSQQCKDNFHSAKALDDARRHQEEEVDPYINQSFDDVPF